VLGASGDVLAEVLKFLLKVGWAAVEADGPGCEPSTPIPDGDLPPDHRVL
jgi:hypothetical protein